MHPGSPQSRDQAIRLTQGAARTPSCPKNKISEKYLAHSETTDPFLTKAGSDAQEYGPPVKNLLLTPFLDPFLTDPFLFPTPNLDRSNISLPAAPCRP